MCEREGRGGENCPYQMHCPKRCVTCGDDGAAVCLNPVPIKADGEALPDGTMAQANGDTAAQ